MNGEGDYELGRPRYQGAPGEQAAGGRIGPPGAGTGAGAGASADRGAGVRPGPLGGAQAQAGQQTVAKTAPSAVAAMAFAAIGWMLPVFGGVIAIRRAKAALREIEAADGELDGLPLAVWARRLGWVYVVVWSAVLFYLALQLYVVITNMIVTVK
jgi:hypothetical protein